ncbi:MAG: 6-phosphofructokinase [Lentisphaerae bacterium RIFOXYB12_FULL_65_16]|nr:MAG: 6-phosphofructokinase [Lentisphaerae bacterium RIFOXYA12_64_32]OGV92365.1 MAG: 6-phosphofructokinase [Lentisphaerae bacterium RIFOXYB12_FULL_65_16]
MSPRSKTRCVGLLTSGGDCPGLNAAIRAITKAAMGEGIKVVGIQDGFRGLVENRTVHLDDATVSGILTRGGTILGTSRDKPHKMLMGGKTMDMTATAVQNARRLEIDCLVCLGGGGTQRNALRLAKQGLKVLTLPKTIDNDVAETDTSFGFDTAMCIATEAIDRLHTTATSHHRIIVCEVMGHRAGWLALGAGIASGADVILIPELPYDLSVVAHYLLDRRRSGKRFSIIAVAEGAVSKHDAEASRKKSRKAGRKRSDPEDAPWHDETRDEMPLVVRRVRDEVQAYHVVQEPKASLIARRLQELTGTEARVTSLGHVQRGGVPSAFDRLLCTQLGTRAAQLLVKGVSNVMVAYRGGVCEPVPIERVAGNLKVIPPDHSLIESARLVGTCLGDRWPNHG